MSTNFIGTGNRFPLQQLLEKLEHKANFKITPLQFMRVQQLLHENAQLLLTQKGREELKWLIAPMVCMDANQQYLFYQVYDQHIQESISYSEDEINQLEREANLENLKHEITEQELPEISEILKPSEAKDPNWVKWLPFISLALVGSLILTYLVAEAFKPEPIKIRFSDSIIEVQEGNTIYTNELLASIKRGKDTTSYQDNSIRWQWNLKNGDEIIDTSSNLNWSFLAASDSTYKRQLELFAYDKTSNIPLGKSRTKLWITCREKPKVSGGIIVEAERGFFPEKEIKFGIKALESDMWKYTWTIGNTPKGNDTILLHEFPRDGKFEVKLIIEPTRNNLGKCDTTLIKEIEIKNVKKEKLFPLTFFDLTKEIQEGGTVEKNKWWLLLSSLLLGLSLYFLKVWKEKLTKQNDLETLKIAVEENDFKSRFSPNDKAPYKIPFHNNEEEIIIEEEQFLISNVLRQRKEGLKSDINIGETISATIVNGGFLDLKYLKKSQPSDYLVLIDENGDECHQSKLFSYLMKMLVGQDVLMDVFYYHKKLDRLWNNQYQGGISLKQLSRLYPYHRLILMGNGHSLVDDANEEELLQEGLDKTIKGWKERILVTPLPVVSWTYKEARLHTRFPIFPSDLKGITRAAKFIEAGIEAEEIPMTLRQWENKLISDDHSVEKNSYEVDVKRPWRTLESHTKYLKGHPNVLKWLKGLAVFPDPTWNVTLAIGKKLGVPITFNNLLLLSRIPWLQTGKFPTRLWREILKDEEFTDIEVKARTAVVEELEKANRITKDSFSNYKSEVNLAVQKFAIDPEDETNRKEIEYLIDNGILPKIHLEELGGSIKRRIGKYKQKKNIEVLGTHLNSFENKKNEVTQEKMFSRSSLRNSNFLWSILALLGSFISLISFFQSEWINKSKLDNIPSTINESINTYYQSFGKEVDKDSLWKYFNTGVIEERKTEHAINMIRVSPDGESVLICEKDSLAKLWRYGSTKDIQNLIGHSAEVYNGTFSPNGKFVVTGSEDKTAKMFDQTSGKLISSYEGHTGTVSAIIFSPDGKYLITGSWDKTIKIWDTDSGKEIKTLEGHKSNVNSLAITSDGKTLISASRDRTIKYWNVDTGEEIKSINAHDGNISSVEISPDERQIITAGDDGYAKVWDFNADSSKLTLRGHEFLVVSASFSNDGKKALTASWDRTLKLWDLSNGEEIRSLSGNSFFVSSATFLNNDETVIGGGGDAAVKIWTLDESSTAQYSIDKNEAIKLLDKIGSKESSILKRKIEYNDGVIAYNQLNENQSENFAATIKSQFSQLRSNDSLGILANYGLACTHYFMNELDSVCVISSSILDTDSTFFDRVPAPNIMSKGICLRKPPSMILVDGGTFKMGCVDGDGRCFDDEFPNHDVSVSSFYMGKYEITVKEYMEFVDSTGSNYPVWMNENEEDSYYKNEERTLYIGYKPSSYNLPIAGVTWDNAVAYCKWLSEKTGKKFRLPTEAEWEYAARGGKNGLPTKFSGSSNFDEVGWSRENSGGKSQPVGQKLPNELGIYDMSGNVWEWCGDWWKKWELDELNTGVLKNPKGPKTGKAKLLKGLGWYYPDSWGRLSIRGKNMPTSKADYNGFRIVQEVE